MPAGSERADAPDDLVLVIERIFGALPALVFAAWTRPEHLMRWSAPHGFEVTHCEGELKPGGSWRSCMVSPDGEELWLGGTYKEVVDNRRLVMTHVWDAKDGSPSQETLVTVTFTAHGENQTKMHFRQENFKSAGSRDGHRGGWSQAFERLASLVESSSSSATLSGDREMTISRVFDAPRSLVFAAWMQPDHIGEWWGPNGFTTTTEQMDFRAGGEWVFTMHGPDGRDYPNEIRYREVEPPEKIVYEHRGRKGFEEVTFSVTVRFAEEREKTRLTMTMTFPSAAARDHVVQTYGAPDGLTQTVARLAEYLGRQEE